MELNDQLATFLAMYHNHDHHLRILTYSLEAKISNKHLFLSPIQDPVVVGTMQYFCQSVLYGLCYTMPLTSEVEGDEEVEEKEVVVAQITYVKPIPNVKHNHLILFFKIRNFK